ncbi:MAG: MBL fold metallo-hydrolase [Bacteroidales bacterium]|nr:MBL fold metallo-hydrolase [Bacteroidales bacterium]
MDRREFLNKGAGAVVAAGLGGAVLPAFAGVAGPFLKGEQDVDYKPEEGTKGPLKVRFLGTGAADWKGRDERGDLRRLTSALLDDSVLIDFTPTDADMLPEGINPEVIFYTHSHGDHYNPVAALELGVKRVYLGSTWIERARKDFEKASAETGKPVPEIIPLSPGDKATAYGLTLTALPANHATGDRNELTMMYLVEKKDVRVLYATDTGGIPAIAARIVGIDPHEKGTPITGIIMEATMGMGGDEDFRIFTHSSVETVLRTVHMLTRQGRYLPKLNQPVYLTHMARTLHPTQAELDATLPAPLKAAYDGLEVYFQ